MDEQKSILKEFFRLLPITFTCTILSMSVAGWVSGGSVSEDFSTVVGSTGLSYVAVFQILILAAINCSIASVLTSDKILKNLITLWRLIIIMFSCLIATSIMIIAFGFFPRDSWDAWLQFVIVFIAVFVIFSIVAIIKTKWDEKRYNNLLSEYKERQEEAKLKENEND